jgi:hypothetical protein
LNAAWGAAVLTVGAMALAAPAEAAGVKAGVLSCSVESGWGFVVGSSRGLKCSYSGSGRAEHYRGRISKYGLDIGYLDSGTIVWGVVAPTASLAPGALAGHYGGATGGASVGVGVDAHVLVGGSHRSITLQPVSVEGDTGINVAAGIASITLHYTP